MPYEKELYKHNQPFKIGYVSSNSDKAASILSDILSKYDIVNFDDCQDTVNVILVLGGDGFMLRSIHRYMHTNIPFYGLNCGTVGFLLNDYDPNNLSLIDKIKNAYSVQVSPLHVKVQRNFEHFIECIAVNEISLLRSTYRTAFMRIKINKQTRIEKLIGDGLLASTPIGSSAYNFSVGGAILPFYSELLSITPISPFRPRRWSGAILPMNSEIEIDIIDHLNRPVSVVADHAEFSKINYIKITKNMEQKLTLLFNSKSSLEERIISEQFMFS